MNNACDNSQPIRLFPAGMSSTLDLLFLGSGASAPVPELRCLVRPKKSPLGPCDVCLEAQSNPESKNIRGCTSGVIVKQWDDGRRRCDALAHRDLFGVVS